MKPIVTALFIAFAICAGLPSAHAYGKVTGKLSCEAIALEKAMEEYCVFCEPNGLLSFELKSIKAIQVTDSRITFEISWKAIDDDLFNADQTARITVHPIDRRGPIYLCDAQKELK